MKPTLDKRAGQVMSLLALPIPERMAFIARLEAVDTFDQLSDADKELIRKGERELDRLKNEIIY